jgi:4-hydroxy-tetrahydrodipicolinate synthase
MSCIFPLKGNFMNSFQAPAGVWPAMITPLHNDKSIDWDGVDALTDWFIESGVAGLFAVGQSGEMFRLSNDERVALAKRVVERTAGRVPVVATGTFGGPISEQAAFIKRMADTGVQAVTVISGTMAAASEDETVWQQNVEQLLEATGDINLALYECPEPYHRVIAPESVRWAASTGRFYLLKETSRSMEAVQAKIAASEGTPLRVFNADTTGLLETLRGGGYGYCGIAANFYPDLLAWVCNHYADMPEKAEVLQAFFASVDGPLHVKYPVCAKYFRNQAGIQMLTLSRTSDAELHVYDRRVLDGIAVIAEQMRLTLPA